MVQVYVEAPHAATHILKPSHNTSIQKEMAERAQRGDQRPDSSVKPYQNQSDSTSLPPKSHRPAPSRFIHPLPPRPPSPGVMPAELFTVAHSQRGIRTTHPNYGSANPRETFGFRQPTNSNHIRSSSHGQIAPTLRTRYESIHPPNQSPQTILRTPIEDLIHERDVMGPRRASSGEKYHHNLAFGSFRPR